MANLQNISREVGRRFVSLHRLILLLTSMTMLHLSSTGQTIHVNADGTHTLIFNNSSNPSVQVNPNGTHTLIYDNGCTQTWVNPDGTHSVMLNANTQTPVLVNPEGTHTQIFRNGNIEIRTLPDGRSKTYFISDPFISEISSIGSSTFKERKVKKKLKRRLLPR